MQVNCKPFGLLANSLVPFCLTPSGVHGQEGSIVVTEKSFTGRKGYAVPKMGVFLETV